MRIPWKKKSKMSSHVASMKSYRLDRFSGLRLEGVLSGSYYEMEDQANKGLRS